MKFIDIFRKPKKVASLKPFTYVTPSVDTVRKFILIMLVPQVVMLFVTKSFASLGIALATVLASFIAEIIFCAVGKERKVEYLSPVIQGLFVGLLLPSGYSIVSAFFITLCAMLLGKYVFGGFAQSWVNSVALAVAVAYMLNIPAFSTVQMGSDVIASKNFALTYIQNPEFHIASADSAVTAFLNRTVFRIFGIVIPDGYVSFFWDNGAAIPAFRFNFITVISSIVLFALNIVDFIVPMIFVVIYSLMVRFLCPIFTGAPTMQGDMIFALLTSGILFSSLYLLQWYGTLPISNKGKIVYAIFAAVLAFFIIGYGNSSVGFVFTILISNLFSTVIQVFESKMARKKVQSVLTPRIQAIREAENV